MCIGVHVAQPAPKCKSSRCSVVARCARCGRGTPAARGPNETQPTCAGRWCPRREVGARAGARKVVCARAGAKVRAQLAHGPVVPVDATRPETPKGDCVKSLGFSNGGAPGRHALVVTRATFRSRHPREGVHAVRAK